ncbi:hypothetical protein [Comamonas aquatica]|uniref:hypothetical protein n=1 Tax=Comamonas aquatica TaxID=225991 RepID=UPI001B37D6BA|nr:hypothetical protein [Comamonas aquatica]QTX21565.1 hypothetical protein KAQ61_03420 [Comamonas aquatica]
MPHSILPALGASTAKFAVIDLAVDAQLLAIPPGCGQFQQSRWGMHSQRTTLAWPGGKNAWTLAGFQIRRPGGKKEGFDSKTPTQTATTPTRGGLGAGTDSIVTAH